MSKAHAVVIDDNSQNLKVLAQMLTKQDVSSTQVADPRKLSEIIPTLEKVDVVFLDLELPGIDGYSVKDIIRSLLDNVPVVAYTVHVSEMKVVRELGFDGFIGKPLDALRFPDQLTRILNGEGVWDRG